MARPKKRTREQILREIQELQNQNCDLAEKLDKLKASDPFWYFVPSNGTIPDNKRQVLLKYIKAEHIPLRVDCQLDVLLSRSGIKGVSGGNRAGKTLIGTIDGIIKSTGELPQSMECYREKFQDIITRAKKKVVRGRVVAVDFKQLHRVVIESWKRWVPRAYLKNGSWSDSYSSQHETLSLYRGKELCATVQFMTNQMDTESFQGDDLDWVKFDEEPMKDIFKENRLRFLTAERLDMEIDWTPTKGLTWATDMFHSGNFEGKEDKIELFKLCTVSNETVNIEVVDDIAAECESYDEMLMRFFGEAISLSGLVYGNLFNRRIHVIPPFTITKDYLVYRGLDPHLVKPTVCVELAIDREGMEYVCGTYMRQADTEVVKQDLADRVKDKGYRLGKTKCDRSANSTIHAFGGRNIFQELARGKNAIPALDISEKFDGSIHAGVDEIKKKLRIHEVSGKPMLFIFDIPENQTLIRAMETMERHATNNEEKMGINDKIAEGKHDTHAALRYIHQMHLNWFPARVEVPTYEPVNEMVAY
jgi:phage terminase large subunit-like protein